MRLCVCYRSMCVCLSARKWLFNWKQSGRAARFLSINFQVQNVRNFSFCYRKKSDTWHAKRAHMWSVFVCAWLDSDEYERLKFIWSRSELKYSRRTFLTSATKLPATLRANLHVRHKNFSINRKFALRANKFECICLNIPRWIHLECVWRTLAWLLHTNSSERGEKSPKTWQSVVWVSTNKQKAKGNCEQTFNGRYN